MITVESLKQAYEKTGLKPVSGICVGDREVAGQPIDGCAFVALFVAAHGGYYPKDGEKPYPPLWEWVEKVYGDGYHRGFLAAWDKRAFPSSDPSYGLEGFHDGYKDGLACLDAIHPEAV